MCLEAASLLSAVSPFFLQTCRALYYSPEEPAGSLHLLSLKVMAQVNCYLPSFLKRHLVFHDLRSIFCLKFGILTGSLAVGLQFFLLRELSKGLED